MANEVVTTEKKVYPSQINTKAMACRVPVADYVSFLQESINQGISINDWLLMKVYSKEKTAISGIEDKESKEDLNEGLYTYEEAYEEFNPYPIRLNRPFGIYEINEESDIHNAIIEADNEIIRLRNLVDELKFKTLADSTKPPIKKVASVTDIKAQLTILILNTFEDRKEQKEFKQEIYELLEELE